jgi:hypothetical protein
MLESKQRFLVLYVVGSHMVFWFVNTDLFAMIAAW